MELKKGGHSKHGARVRDTCRVTISRGTSLTLNVRENKL